MKKLHFSHPRSTFCKETFIIYSKFGKDSFGCCRLSALLVFPLSIVSVAVYEVIHFKTYPCSVKRSVPVISKFWREKNKKIILAMTEVNDLGEIRTACLEDRRRRRKWGEMQWPSRLRGHE